MELLVLREPQEPLVAMAQQVRLGLLVLVVHLELQAQQVRQEQYLLMWFRTILLM
jgi:hypothetical protein